MGDNLGAGVAEAVQQDRKDGQARSAAAEAAVPTGRDHEGLDGGRIPEAEGLYR